MSEWSYSEYYRKNKKKISAKKKKRYEFDYSYRTMVKRRARAYYELHKKTDSHVDRKLFRGKEGVVMTIGRLSSVIHRHIQTIRNYHSKGIIPEPKMWDSRGWRLYTSSQVSLLQLVFRKVDRKEIRSLKQAKELIHEGWR